MTTDSIFVVTKNRVLRAEGVVDQFHIETRTGNPTGQPGEGEYTVIAEAVSDVQAREALEYKLGLSVSAAKQYVDLARLVGLSHGPVEL